MRRHNKGTHLCPCRLGTRSVMPLHTCAPEVGAGRVGAVPGIGGLYAIVKQAGCRHEHHSAPFFCTVPSLFFLPSFLFFPQVRDFSGRKRYLKTGLKRPGTED